MRLVIDSNQLQSPRLEEFLRTTTRNQAVITDFAGMEAYKGSSLSTIFKSMEVVSRYPKQVLILKGSRKIFGLSGKKKGLQRRMIDEKQTKEFPLFVRALQQAKAGDTRYQASILEHGRTANEHFAVMLREAEQMRATFDALGKEYSKDERSILRDRKSYTRDMADKLVRRLLELSGAIFHLSPAIRNRPSFDELPNTYFFRVTLACYLLAITRAAHGQVTSMRPDKLRNDFVDMTFVAYGTYFDGILSDDVRVNRMYEEVSILLHSLFKAEVPFISCFRG